MAGPFILQWNFLGWKGSYTRSINSIVQSDWNKTLLTKINQMSATLRKQEVDKEKLEKDFMAEQKIKADPAIEPILKTLDYYEYGNDGSVSLCGRYKIVFDDNLNYELRFGDNEMGIIQIINYGEDKLNKKLYRVVYSEKSDKEESQQEELYVCVYNVGELIDDLKTKNVIELKKIGTERDGKLVEYKK